MVDRNDPRLAPDPSDPTGIRRAAGLKSTQNTPSFLTPPPPSSYSTSPEIRKLVWLGAGLVFLLIVTLVYAPKPGSDTAVAPAQAAPKAEETAEERQQRLQTTFNGALTKVSDGADFEESQAYLDVVSSIARMESATIHERTVIDFDWTKAVNEPALVRGKFVRVRGIIARIDTIKLRTPAGTVTDVWRCYVGEADGSERTVIDLVEKPARAPSMMYDVVDIDAVVLRVVGFEAEKSGKHVEMPYLIAKTLSIYTPPPRGPQGWTQVVLLVGLVLAAVVIAVFLARSRGAVRRHPAYINKPGVGMRELFEMRRREELARKSAAAAAAASATPPPPPAPPS